MKIIILILILVNLNMFASKVKQNNGTILLVTPRTKFDYKRERVLRSAIRKSCNCDVKTAYYKYVDSKMIKKIAPFAIIIGGQNTPWTNYKEDNLKGIKDVIKNNNTPILGICGGHQLIASTYEGKLGWINENYNGMKSYRKCKRVSGYIKLDAFINDLIFKGIDKNSKFLTKHCEIVKEVPKDFTILASYRDFIYAMKYNKKLIYGTQFHPESSKAGRIILKNFIDMARHH
jgi:GMP synthase (glutamine-hydrolysing)